MFGVKPVSISSLTARVRDAPMLARGVPMRRWAFVALTTLSIMVALACSSGKALEDGGGTAGAGTEGMLTVQRIEVQVVGSAPPEVFVHVHGVLLDGCTFLGAVEQHRDGQMITVTIATRHTKAEVCTMIAQLVDKTIRLDGAFTPGSYTVNVNGVVGKFSV